MITICPNCGAVEELNRSGECSRCGKATLAAGWLVAPSGIRRGRHTERSVDEGGWPEGIRVFCPKCGQAVRPLSRGGCTGCGQETPSESWIVLSPTSIPPVPELGHPDPRKCPTCGKALRWRPGAGSRWRALAGLVLSAWWWPPLAAFALFERASGLAWGYLLAACGMAAAALVLFLLLGGLRFASEGVVTCISCGYLRIGPEESARDRLTRDRAFPIFRWAEQVLILAAAAGAVAMLALLSFAAHAVNLYEAGLVVLTLALPGAVAWECLLVFRPRERWSFRGRVARGLFGKPPAWEEQRLHAHA